MTGPLAARSTSQGVTPKIVLEREGDRIKSIRIECVCGQVIVIDCIY